MRKLVAFTIIVVLLSSFGLGTQGYLSPDVPDNIWRVVENQYFGLGGLNLDNYATRAEFATIAVRFTGMKDEEVKAANEAGPFTDTRSFQGGWAVPHIGMAHRMGLMLGINNTQFNPGGDVTYIQLLIVMMRLLGYKDGEDFISYPIDHYGKAVELGLADRTLDLNQRVTRGLMAETMERTLDLKIKNKNYTLAEYLGVEDSRASRPKITIVNSYFSTSVVGAFSGQLMGLNYYKDYRMEIVSRDSTNPKILKAIPVNTDGSFELSGFDISVAAQLIGYRYRLYDGKGRLVLEGNLK